MIGIDIKEGPLTVEGFRDHHAWTFPIVLDEKGSLPSRFSSSRGGLPPDVVIINSHWILDAGLTVRHVDYLNVATFDASVKQVVTAVEKLLREKK